MVASRAAAREGPSASRSFRPPPGDVTLLYPDPSIDPARSQAKQLLARLFQDPAASLDNSPSVENGSGAALDAYRQRHAKAEGTLAGRTWATSICSKQRPKRRTEMETANFRTGRRSAAILTAVGSFPVQKIYWIVLVLVCRKCRLALQLENRAVVANLEPSPAVNAAQARTLAFYPVIVGDKVLTTDSRYVTAFNLRNGKSEQWYDAARQNAMEEQNSKLPAL